MSISSPLDLDHATMQRLGRQVADSVAAHLASLREQRVLTNGLPAATRNRIAAPPASEPTPFDDLLRELQNDVFPYSAREPHPGFMAYVPGCPTFPAVLGDWLATGYNFFAGVWPVAEGPNAVELAVLEWFRQWTGMPAGSGGLLTNGGSGATLTAIIAARHAAVGDDATRLAQLTLYASDQAHSAALRAAWIAGVPRSNVRVLASDTDYRLSPTVLREAIGSDRAAGLIPLAVVVSAGTRTPAPSIRSMPSPTSVPPSARGCTPTPHTGDSLHSRSAAPRCSQGLAAAIPLRSIRTNGCSCRSSVGRSWYASPSGCAPRFRFCPTTCAMSPPAKVPSTSPTMASSSRDSRAPSKSG
jgi:hypothetical protein